MMPAILSSLHGMIRTANHLCILCYENEAEDACPARSLIEKIEEMKCGDWEEQFFHYAYCLYREKWMEEHGLQCLKDSHETFESEETFRLNEFADESVLSAIVGAECYAAYISIRNYRTH